MHTKDIGDISEYKVITKFLERGWAVSKTIGDNQLYDIVLDRQQGKLERVQVKTAHVKGDIVKVQLKSAGYHIKDGKAITFSEQYNPCEVEVFAAYCPELDKVYLILNDHLMHDINLRLTEPKKRNGRVFRFAKDFEV